MYWYNPETCALEFCVAKTLKVDRAAKGPGARAGGQADVPHEARALQWVAGVPGVVGYCDTIPRANGGFVIVMEYVLPWPSNLRGVQCRLWLWHYITVTLFYAPNAIVCVHVV